MSAKSHGGVWSDSGFWQRTGRRALATEADLRRRHFSARKDIIPRRKEMPQSEKAVITIEWGYASDETELTLGLERREGGEWKPVSGRERART